MSAEDTYDDNDSIPESAPRPAGKKPSEFAGFMRDTFIRALDHYATTLVTKGEDGEKRAAKPIRKIADHWLDLEETQKVRFFDQVIGAAEIAIAAAPVAIATLRERSRKKKETASATATPRPKAKPTKGKKTASAAKKPAKKKVSSEPKTKKKKGES